MISEFSPTRPVLGNEEMPSLPRHTKDVFAHLLGLWTYFPLLCCCCGKIPLSYLCHMYM